MSNEELYEEIRKLMFHPGELCLWDMEDFNIQTASLKHINILLSVSVTKRLYEFSNDVKGFCLSVKDSEGLFIEMYSFQSTLDAMYPNPETITINSKKDIEKFKSMLKGIIMDVTKIYTLN